MTRHITSGTYWGNRICYNNQKYCGQYAVCGSGIGPNRRLHSENNYLYKK